MGKFFGFGFILVSSGGGGTESNSKMVSASGGT